jgi:urea transport system substrate-binding protein
MPTYRGHRGTFTIGLVVPIQGPAGIIGPSCELCAQLAVEEVNAGGGVLGRELRLLTVDGGAPPARVADEIDRLISAGQIHAVVGWHISAVREVLAPRIAQRVPYVYTALYEGGERSTGVFLTGETPQRQILPALHWMAREIGVRRWCIVGNDYIWPRRSAAVSRGFARICGAEIRDEIFVRLGTHDFRTAIGRLERSECEGVLMFLVGEDAVHFNRQFARAEMDRRCVRLSPLMDENMLLATGADNTAGVYVAAGYFECLPTAESLDFNARYTRRFGVDAPVLNSLGESCYEGLLLLAELIRRAGSSDVRQICAVAQVARYGGPRGELGLRDAHVEQRIYLARAAGLEFDIVSSL